MTNRVISIINTKGGVGKTSLVSNLALSLSKQGYKVLAVDCDPEAGLTNMLNYGVKKEFYSIGHLMQKKFKDISGIDDQYLANISIEEAIEKVIVKPTYMTREFNNKSDCLEVEFGFDLLPASFSLWEFEWDLMESREYEQKPYCLHDLLVDVTKFKTYDYILVDCKPSLGFLTVNAIIAGKDGILIPLCSDLMVIRTLPYLLKIIKDILIIIRI